MRLFFKQRVLVRAAAKCCLLILLALVQACSCVPSGEDFLASSAVLPELRPGVSADERARFRQIFCELTTGSAAVQDCDALLWRLHDEPSPPAIEPAPLDRDLRVYMVGGAFSDCFGDASRAFHGAVRGLAARGYPVYPVTIKGRSGAEVNARLIAAQLASPPKLTAARTVLVGYSKGVVDILEFLVRYPELALQVDAVVGVAGPVYGSQVAGTGAWAYDSLLSGAFAQRCDPGDGGVVDSLLPDRRRAWLARHELPGHIRYFTLAAFTTDEGIARALQPSWQLLAGTDKRNDGQLVLAEVMIPGSSLLGYANVDHWGLALSIEQALPFLAGREDATRFPRERLFEAILRFVGSALSTPTPTPTPTPTSAPEAPL